jgi:hypothetical protein
LIEGRKKALSRLEGQIKIKKRTRKYAFTSSRCLGLFSFEQLLASEDIGKKPEISSGAVVILYTY